MTRVDEQAPPEASKKQQVYDDLFGMSSSSPGRRIEATSLVSQPAMISSSSSGSTESIAADCAIAPVPQCHSASKEDDFAMSMADMVKDCWLKKLRDTAPENVETFVVGADAFYESIRCLGGDVSTLRTQVDAYVSHVRAFLTARENDGTDVDSVGHSIVRVERDLKSFQATLEDVSLDVRNRKDQLSSILEKRAKLEASLQALNDEEVHLKRQQNQQLEEISSLEPKIRTLEQQHEDLKASESRVRRLKEMEHELDLMRKKLGIAP